MPEKGEMPMFFPGSRYQNQPTNSVTLPDGTQATAVTIPLPKATPLAGFHRRRQGDRLDLIANHYLGDPTAFWHVCNANNAVVPDALLTQELIGIPAKGQ
jgi:hypothetical protein